jgi:hypothetical protein
MDTTQLLAFLQATQPNAVDTTSKDASGESRRGLLRLL